MSELRRRGRPKKPDIDIIKTTDFNATRDIISQYRTELTDRLTDEDITTKERIYIEELLKIELHVFNILVLKALFSTTKLVADILRTPDLQDLITYTYMNAKKLLNKICKKRIEDEL